MALKMVRIQAHTPEPMLRCVNDRWSLGAPVDQLASVLRDDGDTLIVTCEVDGHDYVGRLPREAAGASYHVSTKHTETDVPRLLQILANSDAKDAEERDAVRTLVRKLLEKMTPDQRCDAFSGYCKFCWEYTPGGCHCMNDE